MKKTIIGALTLLTIGFTSVTFANTCPSMDKVKSNNWREKEYIAVDGDLEWKGNVEGGGGKVNHFINVIYDPTDKKILRCTYRMEHGGTLDLKPENSEGRNFEILDQRNWEKVFGTLYRCGEYGEMKGNKYIPKDRTVDQCRFKAE
ncbi:MAG: DUF3757 domain-containing protein [Rickettsia endosymbiont of Ixodes persulcatus]|nr:DUF3757 domain-containing protein [Rickettsia endosymbiont of Ixodes persulcatus]